MGGNSGVVGSSAQGRTCGVNPVTRRPGLLTDSGYNARGGRPGGLGNLRPGVGGAGGFRERTGNAHDAVDIVAPVGTPIYANRTGDVVAVQTGNNGGYGNTVIVQHYGGIHTQYSHLSSIFVSLGQYVIMGQQIGSAGRTGNVPSTQNSNEDHVHFGVFSGEVNSRYRPNRNNWQNPATYLNSRCPPGEGAGQGNGGPQ